MNETKEAEQFAQDVDDILQHTPSGASNQRSQRYQREMEIVQALATADFSSESQVRLTLKQQLRDAYLGQRKYPMRTQPFQRSFVRLAIASLALLLLILALSPLGASLAQSIVQIVQNWQVGENTTAVRVDGDFEAVPDETGATIILPAPESPLEMEEIPVDEGRRRNVRLGEPAQIKPVLQPCPQCRQHGPPMDGLSQGRQS